ncbi:MAG: protease modulator HflC [Fibrobacterota bacterium]
MKIFFFVISVCLLAIIFSSAFILSETEQAVVTRLGKIVRTNRKPGLKFKVPFIERSQIYSKKILNIDETPDKINTMDKKYLLIDSFSKWKITDPKKFKNTLLTVENGALRINSIIQSDLREKLGRHSLHEIVASEKLEIMSSVAQSANRKLDEYGVSVVDVRIKTADLPPENEEAVFERMRAERMQQAAKYRGEGEEESQKIRAEADKKKEILMADSYKKSQIIKAVGDAEAASISADVYAIDPSFFSFVKSLETYRKVIDTASTIVLPVNKGFLKGLQSPQ